MSATIRRVWRWYMAHLKAGILIIYAMLRYSEKASFIDMNIEEGRATLIVKEKNL